MSLRDSADEITSRLADEIGDRVRAAGVTIVESRLSHLAYAPEIAQAMLRRQQASRDRRRPDPDRRRRRRHGRDGPATG